MSKALIVLGLVSISILSFAQAGELIGCGPLFDPSQRISPEEAIQRIVEESRQESEALKMIHVKMIDGKPYFGGFRDVGAKKFFSEGENEQLGIRIHRSRFRNMDTMYEVARQAMIGRLHQLWQGPPGSGKTAAGDFVRSGEPSEDKFDLLVNQMTTEDILTGGRDFEKAKEGIYIVNTEGTLVRTRFGSLDEVEKGSPGLLGALFSLMNEGQVRFGDKTEEARLRSLFMYSNANLIEMDQMFREAGMRSTGLALFNRAHIKMFFHNWLNEHDQAFIDRYNERRSACEGCALLGHPEYLEELNQSEKLPAMDWEFLEGLSKVLFKPTRELQQAQQKLMNQLRILTYKDVLTSEEEVRDGKRISVYIPSAEYTERFRQIVTKFPQISAMYSLLKSPELMKRAAARKEPIPLDILSLWRVFPLLTTVTNGEVRLDKNTEGQWDIRWGEFPAPEMMRDEREREIYATIRNEQQHFEQTFKSIITGVSSAAEGLAEVLPGYDEESGGGASFEQLVIKYSGG